MRASILIGGTLALTGILAGTVWLVQHLEQRADRAIQKATDEAPARAVRTAADELTRSTEKISELAETTLDHLLGARARDSERRTPSTTSSQTPQAQSPADLVGDLFKMGHEVSAMADQLGQQAFGLSSAEEITLGRQIHQVICSREPVVDSSPETRRLRRLAEPFVKRRARGEIDYQFLVIDRPEINAFAHAGGYVYLYGGLIEALVHDGQIQFVLGHEVAHVDLKHCAQAMAYAARAGRLAGPIGENLAALAYVVIARGYSEEQEFEADATSLRWLESMGQPRSAALGALQQLAQRLESPEPGRSAPAANPFVRVAQEIDNHFRSHPPARERIERLKLSSAGHR